VKYRVHNEFLQVDGGKMSKSLGNVYNLKDIEAKGFSPLDLRYFYFMAQYGNFQNFTWDQLEAAKNSRKSLIKKMQKLFDTHTKVLVVDNDSSYQKLQNEITSKYVWDALEDMLAAIMDDINTPQLLAILNQSLTAVDKMEEIDTKDLFIALYRLDSAFLKLGLFDWIGNTEEKKDIPAEVTALADQRLEAKKNKDFALADELRGKIQDAWWEIKDTKDGYEFSKR